jgi:hypothetical protein
MGRQWLLAKRQVNAKKRSAATGKLVKEISVAAKMGGADPDGNARLFAAVEKARGGDPAHTAVGFDANHPCAPKPPPRKNKPLPKPYTPLTLPKQVVLRNGTHYLAGTITLGAADSGLTFTAFAGETPTISGALPR